MPALRLLSSLDCQRRTVLLRADFNVPTTEAPGVLSAGEDNRLREGLPTIRHLLRQRARIVVITHWGRPRGRIVPALRLDPIARRLGVLLDWPVQKINDICGPAAREAVGKMQEKEILCLENVRFDSREEKNDFAFARALAALGDVMVSDAFAVMHRAHASVATLPKLLPSAAGLLVEKEIKALDRIMTHPRRPLVAVVSGAKLETKVALLRALARRVDVLLLGGVIANVLLSAQGKRVAVPNSTEEIRELARKLIRELGSKLVLPVDVRVAQEEREGAASWVARPDQVKQGELVLDIGPRTAQLYCQHISRARTVIWNGPLGRAEIRDFAEGTLTLARCLAEASAYSVVGGGDTVAILSRYRCLRGFNHVSSGGGAMLAYLEGATLPGLQPLLGEQAAAKQVC